LESTSDTLLVSTEIERLRAGTGLRGGTLAFPESLTTRISSSDEESSEYEVAMQRFQLTLTIFSLDTIDRDVGIRLRYHNINIGQPVVG
jgi:hypothetical protein